MAQGDRQLLVEQKQGRSGVAAFRALSAPEGADIALAAAAFAGGRTNAMAPVPRRSDQAQFGATLAMLPGGFRAASWPHDAAAGSGSLVAPCNEAAFAFEL